MEESNSSVLLVRRNEYVSELIASMKEKFMAGMQRVYDTVRALNQNPHMLLRDFQLSCKDIAIWTNDRVEEEVTRFKNPIHLAKVLRAIDLLNQRIYTSQGHYSIAASDSMVDFNAFVHQCYLQLGRELWKAPQIMYHGFPRPERHVHQVTLSKLVVSVMKIILRKRIPFEDLEATGPEVRNDLTESVSLPSQLSASVVEAPQAPAPDTAPAPVAVEAPQAPAPDTVEAPPAPAPVAVEAPQSQRVPVIEAPPADALYQQQEPRRRNTRRGRARSPSIRTSSTGSEITIDEKSSQSSDDAFVRPSYYSSPHIQEYLRKKNNKKFLR